MLKKSGKKSLPQIQVVGRSIRENKVEITSMSGQRVISYIHTYLLFCFLKDKFYAMKILTYTYIPIKNILAIKLQAKEIIQNCYQMSLPNIE